MNITIKFLIFISLLLAFSTLNAQTKSFKKSIKVNGRLQYDYEFLKRENSNDWFNGNEFRRLQIAFSGMVSTHFKYKVQTDFSHSQIKFEDVYLKYINKKWGNITIGNYSQPIGLAALTSSKYIPFFERPMLASLDGAKRATGLHYENFGLLNGKLTFQMSYTNNGDSSAGHQDKHLEKTQNFTARITSALLNDKAYRFLIHLGLNYAHRPNNDLKFRAENHMGEKYHYPMENDKTGNLYGMELAVNYASFSLQSEYKSLIISGNDDPTLKSYYVMGSYFLTGEHRPYKHAAFGRVKPLKDIENGGYGAVEFLVRYSAFDSNLPVLISSSNPQTIDKINNWTFGLNWYLTDHVRFMYNYIVTDDQNTVLGQLKGHLIRAQIDF
jgi:phosphate-selective porin OprO/OprP